ncbi:MAG TPA: 30S ribosomal protein S4e [Nitrososphaeraceae archaeon]|nr:30S ribosomal protein S4e [Nitrososphaeraceae archaeon]
MTKKGGDTTVKRQCAPSFWKIRRKQGRFVARARPGPHPKAISYPLGILIRDVLGVGKSMDEVKRILNDGKVSVDGVVRRSIGWPVGLMDIIELIPLSQVFRLVPKNRNLLVPILLSKQTERNLKLLRVTLRKTIKGKETQYGFHDGKTLIANEQYSVGDSCLMDLSNKEVKSHMKLEKGSIVLVTKGENAGAIGKIEEIREGLFSLPKRMVVSFGDRSVELPVQMVMLVGHEEPIIQVS